MDILEYFDNDFKSSINIENIMQSSNRGILVVLVDDLLRVANEKVTLEINWILECIQDDIKSLDFSTISKSIRNSLKQSYFYQSDKQSVIDYVISLTKSQQYHQFLIDKSLEILQLIITQKLDSNIQKLVVIFGGVPDIDELMALKRQTAINVLITENLQQSYIQQLKQKKINIKPEWSYANLIPDTLFMKQVYSKFTRSNMPFLDADLLVIPHSQQGSSLKKLHIYIRSIDRKGTNVLVMSRDRQTILSLISLQSNILDKPSLSQQNRHKDGQFKQTAASNIKQDSINIYMQMLNIQNLDQYECDTVDMRIFSQQMQNMIPKSNLNDIVSFISLFRNSIIRLPIPVEFISIPCIIAIYIRISKMKSTAQGKDIQLLDKELNINIPFMLRLFQILDKINQFYILYESQVKKYPNLLYLYVINAIQEQQSKNKKGNKSLKLIKSEVIKQNKYFTQRVIVKNSPDTDIQYICKYNDFQFLDPDIPIINNNYIYMQGAGFAKYIKKQLEIPKKTLKMVRSQPITSVSPIICNQYMAQLQRVIDIIQQNNNYNSINTFAYEYQHIPTTAQLIDFCANSKEIPINLASFNANINIKTQIMPLIVIPHGSDAKLFLVPELFININKLQQQFQPLISTIQTTNKYLIDMVDFAHINHFTIYIHDIRRHPFMISTGQINALLTIIIPLLDKMKFQN